MADSEISQRMLQARLDLAQRLGREVGKAEIARKAGIPSPTYGRYESGARKVPSALLPAIAGALETDVAFLLGEREARHIEGKDRRDGVPVASTGRSTSHTGKG